MFMRLPAVAGGLFSLKHNQCTRPLIPLKWPQSP